MINLKFWKNKTGKKGGLKSFSKNKDSLLGIPLLFALSGFAPIRRASKPDTVYKIALLKMNSVRDTVFASYFISVLKQVYPNAKITFFAGESNFNMASEIPEVSNAVRLFSSDFTKSMKIVKAAGSFDIWIDLGVWSRFEAIMTQTASALYKIGFRTEGEHRHFAYDKVVDYSYDTHEIKNIFNLAALLDVEINRPEIKDTHIDSDNNKVVVIHIFADSLYENSRKWSMSNWKEIVEFLNGRGYRVALTGDKKDTDEAESFNELVGANADIDFFVGRMDFAETLKFLRSVSLVISGDTSVLHMASFLGTPVIGLYGPTAKELYAPIGNNAFVISSSGCSGCQNIYGDEVCSMEQPDCMNSISVETVKSHIVKILGDDVETKS